jgi:glycosyltransferase involved in cell wall biosynthesis
MCQIVCLIVLLHCLCLLIHAKTLKRFNIALHAQVHPSGDKVVGSVITTNGLRDAFQKRQDVADVRIFYPAHYDGFLNVAWDYVLIEGWFPSIHTFLSIARNHNPTSSIVFICLDPSYPGLDVVETFAVDGIVTNSEVVKRRFSGAFQTDFMYLAADADTMRPYNNITRDWGAIYVGAGGHMLAVKPELRALLLDALPFGLRLHGSGWDTVLELQHVDLGPLPEYELAPAYNSAEVVLASTIQSQRAHGMVNNRVFEALSCGAVVLTADAPELRELGCDSILFLNATHNVAHYMRLLRSDPALADKLRAAGRQFVLHRHTWDHRTVQLLDFFHTLQRKRAAASLSSPKNSVLVVSHEGDVCGGVRCSTSNCPTLLWLISDHLHSHQDYVFVVKAVASEHLCRMFYVTELARAEDAFAAEYRTTLSTFDVVLAVVTPFDALDQHMRGLGLVTKPDEFPDGAPVVQRHVAYVLGYDPQLVLEHMRRTGDLPQDLSFTHYDSVWYRSDYDVALLQQAVSEVVPAGRWQHMFGVGEAAHGKHATVRVLLVCYLTDARSCSPASRAQLLSQIHKQYFGDDYSEESYVLLLLGGTWNDWLDVGEDESGGFISRQELHRTVHVREGEVGDAVALVQSAEVVVVLGAPVPLGGSAVGEADPLRACAIHPDRAAVGIPGTEVSGGGPSSVEALVCQVERTAGSVGETLWPLVAAAVAGRRIHLPHISPHVTHLVAAGELEYWSRETLLHSMVKVGCDRLLGLGSRHSSFALRWLISGTHDEHFLKSFVANHPAERAVSEKEESVMWVELSYAHFQVGRDGEACLEQRGVQDAPDAGLSESTRGGWNAPGERVCLMRPYRYLALRSVRAKSKRCTQANGAISFFLRGAFYGDPFYSFDSDIPDEVLAVPAPAKWNTSWLAQHEAFVYNVQLC